MMYETNMELMMNNFVANETLLKDCFVYKWIEYYKHLQIMH